MAKVICVTILAVNLQLQLKCVEQILERRDVRLDQLLVQLVHRYGLDEQEKRKSFLLWSYATL